MLFLIYLLSLPLIFARPAHAYLDPGTGSYVFQIFLASALGVILAIKMGWKTIVHFFTHLFKKRDGEHTNKKLR